MLLFRFSAGYDISPTQVQHNDHKKAKKLPTQRQAVTGWCGSEHPDSKTGATYDHETTRESRKQGHLLSEGSGQQCHVRLKTKIHPNTEQPIAWQRGLWHERLDIVV